MLDRINGMIKEIMRFPYEGTGKPEASRHELTDWWFRRVTEKHRLVYRVTENALLVAQCRRHY